MSRPDTDSTDERLDRALAYLLRGGVLIAAAVVLLGGLLYLAAYWDRTPDNHTFHGEPEKLRNPVAIVRAALALDPRGVIQLGLLLLIATPVVRVALSLAGFALERDRTYMVVTALVLAILLFSLAGKI